MSTREAITSPRVVVISTADGESRSQGRLLSSSGSQIEVVASDEHLARCAPLGAEVVVMTGGDQLVGRVEAIESHWARISLHATWADNLPLRHATRVPVDRPAEASWRRFALRKRVTVRLHDISATGCAVTALPRVGLGTTVTLSTRLDDAQFEARGLVVRVTPDRVTFGIVFHELDPAARRALADFLARRIGRV